MGKCPHCGSKSIRKRYGEHKRYKWRCRRCDRVFRRPAGRFAVFAAVAVAVAAVAVGGLWFAGQGGLGSGGAAGGAASDGAGAPLQGAIAMAATNIPSGAGAALNRGGTAVAAAVTAIPSEAGAALNKGGTAVAAAASTVLAPTRTPTTTPTPAPTRTPTVTPIPTPALPPNLRHIEEKRHMLRLINEAREDAGVPPVVLGDNIAAQLHAESALANCFSGHWGVDGLKPYMRYSLAGGYQSNGENASGSDYCIKAEDGYIPILSVREENVLTMGGFMESPGHRDNILRKHHKKVNIGVAWDRYNIVTIQHFEGGYAEYDQLPRIEGDTLSLMGRVKNGARINDSDLGVYIDYDPPPHPLTRGQVARTYCYGGGMPVATLEPPLEEGWFYETEEDEYEDTYEPCPDPYDVPLDAPPPMSHDEANAFWQEAYDESNNPNETAVVGLWIAADKWSVRGDEFSVSADIGKLLDRWGDGVYTVVLYGWGAIDGEDAEISSYSIFHGVTPPDTYYPR